ncbi:hypothetical protein [Prescottella agglutinans]|uniref:Uncharacterized protein n=1 Tax=Prescottella agglutinans TaxID=1644129 RepID=A0ABT6MIZ2_9NOCA|nr:hypothetical protein [Prescottella agglutinans]MDH6284291.1 hypothetical protein [Prescottella agglutinans]
MSTIASRPATGGARFVAYDRSIVRIGNPEDGSAISVRAETWVEEYATILVAQYQEKSSNGFDTVYVQFDAASTGAPGMSHNFGASTEAGGDVAARLKHAYDTRTPVYVAIETRRRKTVEGKRDQPIDVLAPIHALRGATGDSLSGQPQATKANCAKVIVAVGSVDDLSDTAIASDKELRSDMAEWPQLRGNKLGDLPPEGWRCIVHDGKRTGGITQAPAASNAGADVEAIAAAVAAHLGSGAGSNAPAAQRPGAVRGRPGAVAEAKPWEPLNTDGRPNMGSELAAKIRAVHESAVYLFSGALEVAEVLPEITEEQSLDHVWGLTETLLWMADKVQERVVGRINRYDRSHKEAGMWVTQVINTRFPYTVEHITDDAARRDWVKLVCTAAAKDFARTHQMMAAYLGVEPAPAETNSAAQQQQNPTAGQAALAAGAATPPAQEQPAAAQSTPQPEQQQGTAPQRAPQPEPRPLRASEDPAAVAAWKNLADACDMGEHINDLRFILKSAFAAPRGMLGEIEAVAFRRQVEQWATNPPAFRELAAQAYNNDPENKIAG